MRSGREEWSETDRGRDAFTFKSTDHDPPFRRRREQVSLLLNHRNATITIVHSRTKDAKAVVKEADIVIAAVGRAHMVKEDWLKDGAVVIDVGINSVDAPGTKKGYKLVGDVDFQGCEGKCEKITPVPGGVGPMTIAMLLRNTVNSAKRAGQS